jgi:hypothetical protein
LLAKICVAYESYQLFSPSSQKSWQIFGQHRVKKSLSSQQLPNLVPLLFDPMAFLLRDLFLGTKQLSEELGVLWI